MLLELNEDFLQSIIDITLTEDLTYNDNINFLGAFAEEVLEIALYFVPVKDGTLKRSAKIERIGNNYIISFNTPYATYVHELVGNWHKPPTRAKFLENAFLSVYNRFKFEFGEENLPSLRYKMEYSLESVKMIMYIEGVV